MLIVTVVDKNGVMTTPIFRKRYGKMGEAIAMALPTISLDIIGLIAGYLLYNPNVDCKLVLLGTGGVGKTSILHRFVRAEFSEFHTSTIGAAFMTKTVIAQDDVAVKFQMWDTAGQERYHALAPMYYRGAKAALCVYDISSQDSFDKMKWWVSELKKQQVNPNIVIAVAGNKEDLKAQRVVPESEGKKYADSIGCIFMETSAKTGYNIQELFTEIAKRLPSEEIPVVDVTPRAPRDDDSGGLCFGRDRC